MIRHVVAWGDNKNLSGFYNREVMALPNDNDWIIFQDRDVWWCHPHYMKHIQEVINKHGDKFSLFTCMTNRVGNDYQVNKRMTKIENGLEHEQCAASMWLAHRTSIQDITNDSPISGMVMIVKKKLFIDAGLIKDGLLLGADNNLHYLARDNGHRVGLIKGIYVWHYYRNGDRYNTKHLQ